MILPAASTGPASEDVHVSIIGVHGAMTRGPGQVGSINPGWASGVQVELPAVCGGLAPAQPEPPAHYSDLGRVPAAVVGDLVIHAVSPVWEDHSELGRSRRAAGGVTAPAYGQFVSL